MPANLQREELLGVGEDYRNRGFGGHIGSAGGVAIGGDKSTHLRVK